MKNYLVIILTTLLATACGNQKDISNKVATPNPKIWVQGDKQVCTVPLASGITSLPADLAVTTNRTNLPFGRYDGMATRRPIVINKNLSVNTFPDFQDDAGNTGTMFSAFSSDGQSIYVNKAFKDPFWGMYEELIGNFDFSDTTKVLSDIYKINLITGIAINITGGPNRASNFNGFQSELSPGIAVFTATKSNGSDFYTSDGTTITQLSNSLDHVAYGFKTSPDGAYYTFHRDYKIYIVDKTTGVERRINTSFGFNFLPVFSPDSSRIMFWCGDQNYCIYTLATDSVAVLANKNGYVSVNPFIDTHDYHEGGSDIPIWTSDSTAIIYGANYKGAVELMRTDMNGNTLPLTNSPTGSVNYNAQISPDGTQLVYISMRQSQRNLYLLNTTTLVENQLSEMENGCGLQYPAWNNY